jgi:thioredoxin-related protein
MRLLLLYLALWAIPAAAQEPPEWFAQSFLDIREDAAEAARDGKRLMIYFMQDGCPYC